MLARFGKSALRLGLCLAVVIPLFLAMISSASASEEITCTFDPRGPAGGTGEFVRQAGPNSFFVGTTWGITDSSCLKVTMSAESRHVVYADSDFRVFLWGTSEGSVWDGNGFTEPGAVTLRIITYGSPEAGIATTQFIFMHGTGGLAGLHGQCTMLTDWRAGTASETCEYHFDP